jgi:hypothetical protein
LAENSLLPNVPPSSNESSHSTKRPKTAARVLSGPQSQSTYVPDKVEASFKSAVQSLGSQPLARALNPEKGETTTHPQPPKPPDEPSIPPSETLSVVAARDLHFIEWHASQELSRKTPKKPQARKPRRKAVEAMEGTRRDKADESQVIAAVAQDSDTPSNDAANITKSKPTLKAKRLWTPVKNTAPPRSTIPDSDDDGDGNGNEGPEPGDSFASLIAGFRREDEEKPRPMKRVKKPAVTAAPKATKKQKKPNTLTARALAIERTPGAGTAKSRARIASAAAVQEQALVFGTSSQLRNESTQEVVDFNTAMAESLVEHQPGEAVRARGLVSPLTSMWDLGAVPEEDELEDVVFMGDVGEETLAPGLAVEST